MDAKLYNLVKYSLICNELSFFFVFVFQHTTVHNDFSIYIYIYCLFFFLTNYTLTFSVKSWQTITYAYIWPLAAWLEMIDEKATKLKEFFFDSPQSTQ